MSLSAKELDIYFMGQALKEAQKAYLEDEVPVGSVIVIKNKIIAKGYNQVELLKDATAHAEILAITSASAEIGDWRLAEATLYCTLEPCLMCAGAMFASRIKRLVWGAEDLRLGVNGSWKDVFGQGKNKYPLHQIEVTKHILKAESAFLLKEFFQKKRREKTAVVCGGRYDSLY